MNLQWITFTGADHSVSPDALVRLSREYPLIEWGILHSADRAGQPRYSARRWIEEFVKTARRHRMVCSLHLCGQAVDDFIDEDRGLWTLVSGFNRIQLNLNHSRKPKSLERLVRAAGRLRRPFITQHHAENTSLTAAIGGKAHHILFDASGGHGQSPAAWPSPFPNRTCGYAGGLGPGNLETELPRIIGAARKHPFWIDMESSLRRLDDCFGLGKAAASVRIVEAEQQKLVAAAVHGLSS